MNTYAEFFADRYGTASIADAAFRSGVEVGLPVPGLMPLDPKSKLGGPAITVEANNDLVSILDAVRQAQTGDVVVISNDGPNAGLMGGLIGTEAVRKGLAGFVVDGLVRAAVELIGMGLPVICRGTFPVGPLKVEGKQDQGSVCGAVSIGGAPVTGGAWVFGDADGVVVVDADALPAIFDRAAIALEQEEALATEISSGTPLAEAFDLDSFLEKRSANPDADFNAHLAGLDRAI